MDRYYNSIPIGKENAISRAELAAQWGVSDRLARRIVAQLRAEDNGDGYIIVAYSSRKGYYRTDDVKEIRRFEREMHKRARNTFAPLKKARRVLRDGGNGTEADSRESIKRGVSDGNLAG